MALRTVKRWIRRRVRCWLGVEAELAELRVKLGMLERRMPEPERRPKVHASA